MFRPDELQKEEDEEFMGIHNSTVRKMTKSEKKKKKIGAINNLNPDLNFEVMDPMAGIKKAARHMRFQSDQVDLCIRRTCFNTIIQAERNKNQKRSIPLQLQLLDSAPTSFDPNKMKIIGTSTGIF